LRRPVADIFALKSLLSSSIDMAACCSKLPTTTKWTSAGAASKTKPSAKKAVAKKAVVKKVAATKKVAVKKVVAKKAVSAKVPAKKAPAKNAPRQSVAVPAPLAAVESGAELTT
jgi:hypothetical protein